MSWQKRSIKLILGLPLAMPIVSYAIEVGDTYVESGQNQPLIASINVTDIDPATFSVKLANPTIYHQMGLSTEQPIHVKFQPTSSNGGKIILTSKQPVASPYTDVVLDIQNKGEKKVLPKTLLVPLGSHLPPAPLVIRPEPSKVIVASNPKIDLPTTTESAKPVIESTPAHANITVGSQPALATDSEKPASETLISNGKITYESDTLIIQETRVPAGATAEANSKSNPILASITQTKPKSISKTTNPQATEKSEHTVTYVIQRNENLWTIANRVAKGTKTDVHAVMRKIVEDNPDAFENGDPSKVIAKTTLTLPKYQTTPSQTGIKNARQIRKQTGKARKSVYTESTKSPVVSPKIARPVTPTKSTKKVVQPRKKHPIVKQKYTPTALPDSRPKLAKTEMVIIAPQQSSGSAQGSMKTPTTSKTVNSQMITQLEQKRQATAAQATKVNQLNRVISSSERKIQIQNQKLAQLEQRLRELNKK